MAETVTLTTAGAALAASGLLLVRPSAAMTRVAVAVPPDLTAEQVETLLGTIAGLPRHAQVTVEVEGADGRLSFVLEAHQRVVATLRAGLQGLAPGIRLSEPDDGEDLPAPSLRAWMGWRGSYVLLRTDQRELAVASLLGVLRAATRNERLRLRVRLRPVVRPKAPAHRRESAAGLLERIIWPLAPLPSDQLRQIRKQYAGPLLNARIEVLVWAASSARARQLLMQLVAVLRARSGVRGRFSVRAHRWARPGMGTMLAPPELVALIGWPLDGPDVPGLAYVRSPQRLPDDSIPRSGGRCFGVSTWPGMEQRQLHQPVVGSLSHALILGPAGSGKSSLLAGLLLDDVQAGRGALLLDMKGDTVLDVLERIPKDRQQDVVVLDPADRRPVPGLKAMTSATPDLTADLWVGLFRGLFADSWGVRSERYLRLGVQTLALHPAAAITELPRVFSDPTFRRQLLSRSPDLLLKSAWASFEALTPSQQAEHLQAPLGKVQDIVGRRVVRAVLGQTKPKTTIAQAMRDKRIVVVRLSPGSLGVPTAQLLGGLLVHEVYQAVMARQQLAPKARLPFGVYVDEPAVMGLSGVPLDGLYELARGMGVGITTATQSVSQLPPVVRSALLTNAATIATFRTGRSDALVMAGELLGVDAEQLQHLGQYEIALRLGLRHGQVASVATAKTLPLPPASSDPELLRDAAAGRYGVAAEETDRQLGERWQASAIDPSDAAPLGRRRVS